MFLQNRKTSVIIFWKAGRGETNIENLDRQCVLSQVSSQKINIFYSTSCKNNKPQLSLVDGVVAACSSLGLDGVSRERQRKVDVESFR